MVHSATARDCPGTIKCMMKPHEWCSRHHGSRTIFKSSHKMAHNQQKVVHRCLLSALYNCASSSSVPSLCSWLRSRPRRRFTLVDQGRLNIWDFLSSQDALAHSALRDVIGVKLRVIWGFHARYRSTDARTLGHVLFEILSSQRLIKSNDCERTLGGSFMYSSLMS